jgi:hypothetical protein
MIIIRYLKKTIPPSFGGGGIELTLEEHSVALEDLELVHLGLSHLNDGIVVVLGLLNSQLVWGLLLV